MKNLIYIVLCLSVILTASCNDSPKIYSYDEVQRDSSGVFIFKKNGKIVNGILERHIDHFFLKEPSVRHIKVVDGLGVGIKDYINDECVGHIEYANSEMTGTYYGKIGNKTYTMALKDGMADGLYQVFDPSGKQVYEAVFKDGKPVKTYDFDSNGNKIIPIEEKLDLIAYKTGFYEYVNYNHNTIVYCPIVIMKFKNISDMPINDDESVKITATFIENDEELSSGNEYLIGYNDPPLSPGVSRQCSIMSTVGPTSYNGIYNANISCQLAINGKPYKTIKIANEIRPTNRM